MNEFVININIWMHSIIYIKNILTYYLVILMINFFLINEIIFAFGNFVNFFNFVKFVNSVNAQLSSMKQTSNQTF